MQMHTSCADTQNANIQIENSQIVRRFEKYLNAACVRNGLEVITANLNARITSYMLTTYVVGMYVYLHVYIQIHSLNL